MSSSIDAFTVTSRQSGPPHLKGIQSDVRPSTRMQKTSLEALHVEQNYISM